MAEQDPATKQKEEPTTQQPGTIEGLQLWMPTDSFKLPYNIVNFQEAMSDFQTLYVLKKPGEGPMYCTGDTRVIYHIVHNEAVERRLAPLKRQNFVTSSLQPNQRVGVKELPEEAMVRELHLGLGRTGLFLAINAEKGSDFMVAAQDLKRAFSMLDQPIHTLEELSRTATKREGLIYMFVQVARKHKLLSRKDATELAEALDQGIVPIPKQKNGKSSERWGQSMGKHFIERVSFQRTPIKIKTHKRAREHKAKDAAAAHRFNHEKPKAEKTGVEKKTKAEIFIHRLLKDRRHLPFSAKLATAYDTFLGEEVKPFDIRNDTRVELGRLGVEAYLDSMSEHDADVAGQILRYVDRRKGNYRHVLLPLVAAGNLLTAKVNEQGGIKGKKLPLPGLTASGIPQGFQAIRYAVSKSRTGGENKPNKMLGDIVEAYLNAAFAAEDIVYEIQDAPEGVVSTTEFAERHDINPATLERVLADYGVDAGNYKFGRFIRRGLAPEDQEALEGVLGELKVDRAPKGYRSVSTFAHLTRTQKSEVDNLIEEHEVETGTHRFRSKLGKSLSPDAQKQLAALLGKEIRIIE